jgi:hypothetical protein
MYSAVVVPTAMCLVGFNSMIISAKFSAFNLLEPSGNFMYNQV